MRWQENTRFEVPDFCHTLSIYLEFDRSEDTVLKAPLQMIRFA